MKKLGISRKIDQMQNQNGNFFHRTFLFLNYKFS